MKKKEFYVEPPRKTGEKAEFFIMNIPPTEWPLLPDNFLASKDIRDKYVLSRLLWDLGSIDEFAKIKKLFGKESKTMKKIYTEGHRGMCAFYPKNTLLSFEAAMNTELDAIEFDVWLSKDKVPVLMHDANAYRTAGVDRNLRDMTLAEIKELDPCYARKFGDTFKGQTKVPTLRELLVLCVQRPDHSLSQGKVRRTHDGTSGFLYVGI